MFGLDFLSGGLTQGENGTASVAPVSSGISGATGFNAGDFTVNKSDNTTLLIIAGVAVVALLVFMRKK